MTKLKIFLCGYHWIGKRVLEHLLQHDEVGEIAVFTHEPAASAPDLRRYCAERNVWWTTESVNTARCSFTPDIVASIYYRDIIRAPIIEQVRGRIFNLHPSLLPRHRGCSSLTWALLEGDAFAGISYHYITPSVDTGNIILQATIQIGPTDTQGLLYQRAMYLGADFWPAAFELVKSGFPGVPQQGEASYHRRGAPFGGQIDPAWSLEQANRFIRAMTNPPYPFATYRGQEVRTMEDYLELRRTIAAPVTQ